MQIGHFYDHEGPSLLRGMARLSSGILPDSEVYARWRNAKSIHICAHSVINYIEWRRYHLSAFHLRISLLHACYDIGVHSRAWIQVLPFLEVLALS